MRATFVIEILVVALVWNHDTYAADVGFWLFDDGIACFRLGSAKTCLPPSFEIHRVEGARIEFVDRSSLTRIFNLYYESGKDAYALVNEYVSPDWYVEGKTVELNRVRIRAFDMFDTGEGRGYLSIRILDFGNANCLVLTGPSVPEIDQISRGIASQIVTI